MYNNNNRTTTIDTVAGFSRQCKQCMVGPRPCVRHEREDAAVEENRASADEPIEDVHVSNVAEANELGCRLHLLILQQPQRSAHANDAALVIA